MHQRKADCKQILNYLSAYIDGDLNENLCQLIEDHLKTCQDCRIVMDTLKKTIDIYQKDAEKVTLPPEVRTRLFAHLALKDDPDCDE